MNAFLPSFLAAVAAVVASFGVGKAADPDDFRVRSTADLVALCAAKPDEPNYVAAIHFCQGFGSGAYQYYEAIATASADQRYVCPPSPPPSRSEVLSQFVEWAQAQPQLASKPPVEALFQFLGETYPCK